MMKRFLCLMLCLAFSLTSVCALAAEEYSLAEKLQRQIDFGNGVKGAVVINAAGESALMQLLAPLNGTEIQLRFIKNMEALDQFQLYLYTLNGEEQIGTTRFYGDDQELYMSSALLPDLLLNYHTGGDAMDTLLQRAEGENPSWYSAAMNILTVPETVWQEDWAPVLEDYYADLEIWLAEYAADPQVNQTSEGSMLMTVRYEIPAEAVKAQAKVLLNKALNDEALMALVRAQLTDEQQFVYLTPGLMYYYEAAIDAMQLEGEVVLERDLSTMGETVSTSLQFPLPEKSGWEALSMDQTQTDMVFSLSGERMNVSVEMETAASSATSANYSGVLRMIPRAEDAKAAAVAFRLGKVFSHTVDDDTREHDVTTWTLDLMVDESVQGDDDYLTFEPVSAALMTHIHSKGAKRNATTLEVTASIVQGTESLSVAGSIKTTSPWVLDQLPVEGAEDVAAMTESYLMEIFSTMWGNLQAELSALKPGTLPAPEAATASDLNAGDADKAVDSLATTADLKP